MSANIEDSAQNQDHYKREDNPEQRGDAPDEIAIPTPEDATTARHALLDGLARDADIFEVLSGRFLPGISRR